MAFDGHTLLRGGYVSDLEYTTFLNTFSVAVANQLSEDALVIAAAALTQVADTLATIAAVRSVGKTSTENFN